MTKYFLTMILASSQQSYIAEPLRLSTIQTVYVVEISFIYSDLVVDRFC